MRLGEAILVGREPLHRRPLDGLHTDAFALVAEVIEAKAKPSRPWGDLAQTAYGARRPPTDRGTSDRTIVAIGEQDVDPPACSLPPASACSGPAATTSS